MADRDLAFSHIFNFRDLGGFQTRDGHQVRWHRLFRSDDLSRLRDEDTERFSKLGIRTVVDLRRTDEIDDLGRIPSLPGFAYHHVELEHQAWPEQTFADTAERAAYVRDRYNDFLVTGAEGATWDLLTSGRHPGEQRWTHVTVSPREGMLALLADLRRAYGSVTAYAASVGVTADDITAMRAHLLEPVR